MRPVRLQARNFGPFLELDVEFVDGVTVILGEIRDAGDGVNSNGAGKSHILMAVDVALFGARDGERTLQPLLTRGTEQLEVCLTFEHAEATYRVRRGYTSTGRGSSTVDLEQAILNTDGEAVSWEPLTRASTKETQELVEQTIGMGRDLARNSWYLAQGSRCFADPSWDNAARKELLAEAVFGQSSPWPALAKRASDDRRLIDAELRQLEAETATAGEAVKDKAFVEDQIAQATREENTATTAVLEADEQRKAAQTLLDQARERATERAAAAAGLGAARAELAQLTDKARLLTDAERAITLSKEEIAALPDPADLEALEAQQAALADRVREHGELVGARTAALQLHGQRTAERDRLLRQATVADDIAARVRGKLTEFEQPDAECDRCGQHLNDGARAKAVASAVAEALAHQDEARELRDQAALIELPVIPDPPDALDDTEAKQVAEQIAAIRVGETQRARIDERIRTAEETLTANADPDLDAKTETARAAVIAAEALAEQIEPVDLTALERDVSQARFRGDQERDRLEAARISRARYEEKLATIHNAEQKLALASARTDELNVELDEVVALERACGRDGVPALILESRAVPFIETVANQILTRLGGTYQVELRTLAETRSGTLRDCLDIVLLDTEGHEASYQTFSGGEQQRITFALQWALSLLLKSQHGADSELLAIDELPYLDDSGMATLADLLVEQTDFPIVLLVSHLPALRDAFERSLAVVQENGRSRIQGTDGLAVAA